MGKRAVVLFSMTALLAGCTSLPASTEPEVLRSFGAPASTQANRPTVNLAPDLLVREFYASFARPEQQYQLSRSYLTDTTAISWKPSEELLVLDRVDVNYSYDQETTMESPSAERIVTYEVTGTITGVITAGGAYEPRNEQYRQEIDLEQIDGQWRISSLPSTIAIETAKLRSTYQVKNLYFFEPGGVSLVSDRRWIASGSADLGSSLITLLLSGPARTLSAGVLNEIPSSAAFAGVEEGVYHLTGLASLDEPARARLIAQLVWTLALADVPGPYTFAIDSDVFSLAATGAMELDVDDFAEYNPQGSTSVIGQLYFLNDGSLMRMYGDNLEPVPGFLGVSGAIESADISAALDAAAIVQTSGNDENKRSTMLVGEIEGNYSEVLSARTLTRPSFDSFGSSLWTVLDGETVLRLVRSSGTGEITQTEVDTSALGENRGTISVFRLSHSGVRVAFIMDGRVYTATVARPNAGERRLVNIQEILPAIEDSALSVDWDSNDGLIIGTTNIDTPIWRVEQDGSAGYSLPNNNIAAPVVQVGANSSTIYATDARSTVEFSVSGSGSSFWREVPGLEGERSVPIISH
ncbi:lipoprotein LpqB [Corynebacterium kutscheri]|uniref:Lipoprotein LpqB n=1 Tax=Corynebacterium kutscheri TaxID=35755 RepID=A0A0F6QZG7_9CORY|nr:LpqB family beta-propeller domain-containing protein [Corynebacterium kutscheri]AKE40710.1 sporulation/spore germination protein [Corynebacterium kutscheri]VEH04656.1 lipoprotein LpqB [Corynebacterium kutscheri]VEH11107.1 lipoprotein LpqB [Corynebacterium kutscheri]VEH80415.1 lipoprotein LpqB [Corynebacterium kutscheri]